ncbi:MAG: DUF2062 domain-containing protein [Bacteroidales bacterium]|nr:DUF2062 domain-containing protein [Bacteroidales bacterium]
MQNIKSRLLQIKESPEKISKGYALGVFLGTTPFIGTKVFIAIGLTSFLKWNRIASVIGVYHINILTAPAFYSAAFFMGKFVTRTHINIEIPQQLRIGDIFTLFLGTPGVLFALLTGGLILGLPMAVFAYYFSISILKKGRVRSA